MKGTLSVVTLTTVLCFSEQAVAQQAPAPVAPAAPLPPKIQVDVVGMPKPPSPDNLDVSLDTLKAGKLISNGFSLGAAYTLHIPAKWINTTNKAQDSNSSFMPYVVFYPLMFWPGSGPETRAYCSANWTLTPTKSAQKVADAHALQRAKDSAEQAAVKADKNAAKPDANTKAQQEAADSRKFADQIKSLELDDLNKLPDDQRKEISKYISHKTGWKIGSPPYCRYRFIGVYAGKPLGISPTIRPADELTDATPASSSLLSFGLAYSPNVAFSFMGGLTYWKFSTDQAPNENRDFWTWTIGVGGNIDVISALVK